MSQTKSPLKVFLCYAHSDSNPVQGLHLYLKNQGLDVWIDKEKLLPGQDWEYEIRNAVREANVVIVCLSRKFNQAGFRQKEVRLALDTAMEQPEGEIFIIPARLQECDTPENLQKWQWVDLFKKDGYERLMDALRARAKQISVAQLKRGRLPKVVALATEENVAQATLMPVTNSQRANLGKLTWEKTSRILRYPQWQGVGVIVAVIGIIIAYFWHPSVPLISAPTSTAMSTPPMRLSTEPNQIAASQLTNIAVFTKQFAETADTPIITSPKITRIPPIGTEIQLPVPINTILPQSSRAISTANADSVRQVTSINDLGGGPLSWSPDGKYLAVVRGSKMSLYDGKTFKLVRALGDQNWTRSFAFMPDGQTLALTGDNGVTIWRADTGGQVKVFADLKNAGQLAISPDGKILAAGINQVIKLVDIASGNELATLPIASSECNLAFSPDGKWLATAGGIAEQDIVVYDVASGQKAFSLAGHSNAIEQVVFSANGNRLASASIDQTVKVWDMTTRLLQTSLTGHTKLVKSVALSPDGKIAVSISWDLTVKLWDTKTGQILNSLTGHTDTGRAIAFSPDGTQIASADDSGGVLIWGLLPQGTDVATPTPRAVSLIPTVLPISAKAIVPNRIDGVKQLAVANDLRARQIFFSPDGQTLIVISDNLYLLKPSTLTTLSTITLDISSNAVTYALDGTRLAETGPDGIAFYQMPSGARLNTISNHNWIRDMVLSPDGGLLAVVANQSIKVWDIISGQEICTLPVGASQGNVAFSPDGKRLVAAGGVAGQEIYVWDTNSWKQVYTLQGHSNWISRLIFAPGSQILASGASDNTIRLWDLATGLLTRTINVPQDIAENSNQIPDIAFSPDGRLLASSYGVPQFSIWDMSSGNELRRFTGPTTMVRTMAFSPDGTYLVTGDDSLRLWGIAPEQ